MPVIPPEAEWLYVVMGALLLVLAFRVWLSGGVRKWLREVFPEFWMRKSVRRKNSQVAPVTPALPEEDPTAYYVWADPTGNPEGTVNIPAATCTCEEFRLKRAHHAPEDPRRLCLHLICAYFWTDTLPAVFKPYYWYLWEIEDWRWHGFPWDLEPHEAVFAEEKLTIWLPDATRTFCGAYVVNGERLMEYDLQKRTWYHAQLPPGLAKWFEWWLKDFETKNGPIPCRPPAP